MFFFFFAFIVLENQSFGAQRGLHCYKEVDGYIPHSNVSSSHFSLFSILHSRAGSITQLEVASDSDGDVSFQGFKHRQKPKHLNRLVKFLQNSFPNHCIRRKEGGISILITAGAGGILILAKVEQQLSELGLCRTLSTTRAALSTEIDELGDSVPAGTSSSSVLSRLEEFLGFLAGLRDGLVLLVVVVLIEIVDRLVGGFDGFFLLVLRDLVSVLDSHVSTLAPFADDVGLGLVFV